VLVFDLYLHGLGIDADGSIDDGGDNSGAGVSLMPNGYGAVGAALSLVALAMGAGAVLL
jgi:hypothetical protein